jgi:hypothetical protein
MDNVNDYFSVQRERIVGRITGLGIAPVTLTRDNQAETVNRFVLSVDDFTHRFVKGYTFSGFTPSRHARSKWQMWLADFTKNTGIVPKSTEDMVGLIVEIEFREYKWESRDRAEPFVARDVPVIIRVFDSEEEANEYVVVAGLLRGGQAGETGAEEGGQASYLRNLCAAYLDGRTYDDFLVTAGEVEDLAENPDLMAALYDPNRAYVAQLVKDGLVSVDAAGIYHQA